MSGEDECGQDVVVFSVSGGKPRESVILMRAWCPSQRYAGASSAFHAPRLAVQDVVLASCLRAECKVQCLAAVAA